MTASGHDAVWSEDGLRPHLRAIRAMVAFRRADRAMRCLEEAASRAHGLTIAQFGVLETLYRKGTLRVSDLLDVMLMTSGNMTVVLRNMERDGLVSIASSPDDRRARLVSITDSGAELIARVLPEHARNLERIFSPLAQDEQEQLVGLLRKLERGQAQGSLSD